jgi:hypothetical protein
MAANSNPSFAVSRQPEIGGALTVAHDREARIL